MVVKNAGFLLARAKFAMATFAATVQVENSRHSPYISVTRKENVARSADSLGPSLTKWTSAAVEWASLAKRTGGISPGVADMIER